MTCPEAGNKYYICQVNGGWNGSVQGSPTHKDCNVLSNCVGYAIGRFNEIGNYGSCKYLSPVNAERFIEFNNTGLTVSQNPTLGACMVWRGGNTLDKSDGCGHVAIVEQIIDNNEVVTSESGWGSSTPFWTQARKRGNGNWGMGNGLTFLGFIPNPAVAKEEKNVGFTNSSLVNYTKISPNKTSPRTHDIDTITIHCVVGQCTVEALGNVFAPTSRQASSNYGVGKDGRIGMYVEEKDRSWCSSNSANDNRAVTIEVASDTTDPYAVTDAAYEALIKLVADICKRNNIKKLVWSNNKNDRVNHLNGCNMTVHRDYANKSCPGDYLYNRHGDIANRVNAILNGNTTEEEEEMTQEQFNTMMNTWIAEQAEKDPGTWSAEQRTWAEKNGYVNGDNQGRKMYKKFLTREEMITVLYRFAKKLKEGLE